jgi:hypothetical protein
VISVPVLASASSKSCSSSAAAAAASSAAPCSSSAPFKLQARVVRPSLASVREDLASGPGHSSPLDINLA